MNDSGVMKKILEIKILGNRGEGKLFLSQKKYIEKVLERFDMLDVKPVQTPLDSLFQLSIDLSSQTDKEEKFMSRIPYASAVRNIMFVMVLDISHVVNVVSRYMDRPGKSHWQQ